MTSSKVEVGSDCGVTSDCSTDDALGKVGIMEVLVVVHRRGRFDGCDPGE